jgi:hypothetical protein
VRDLEEIALPEPMRLFENGLGDRDVVVLGKPAHQCLRSVADWRQLMRQLHARLGIEIAAQPGQHLPEQLDLFAIEPAGAIRKQNGDAPEHLGAAGCGTMPDHFLQFRNERTNGHLRAPVETQSQSDERSPVFKLGEESEGRVSYRIVKVRVTAYGAARTCARMAVGFG